MSRSLYIRYIEAIYLIHPWRGWTSCLSRQNTLRCGSLVRLDVIRHCCLTLLYDAGVLGRGRPEPAVAVLEPDDVLAPTGCGGRGLHSTESSMARRRWSMPGVTCTESPGDSLTARNVSTESPRSIST